MADPNPRFEILVVGEDGEEILGISAPTGVVTIDQLPVPLKGVFADIVTDNEVALPQVD